MLLNYHIDHVVLISLCVGDLVRLVLRCARCASACKMSTTQNQPHQISNTQRTENKTTAVVIQQHSRKLLMMDILMSETCWAHKTWNKIASDIKLIFHSSSMLHFYSDMLSLGLYYKANIENFDVNFSPIYSTLWLCTTGNIRQYMSIPLHRTNYLLINNAT